MYLRNTSNGVKELIEKVNELDNENKMKYIIYICYIPIIKIS